jgi:thiol:disulfide interchange protein
MMFIRWCLLLVAAALGVTAAKAAPPQMDIHVAAGLEAETLRPAAGSNVTLAITMQPEAGWHGYWINPGDAGQGLQLDWNMPAGVTVGAPRFPVPETLMISGLMNYVYERPHAVLVDVKLPGNLTVGSKLPISAEAFWLACTDRVCVPQQGTLQIELTVGDGTIDAAARIKFDRWRAALPVPLDRKGRFNITGKTIEFAFPFPANASVSDPYFFPLTDSAIDYAAPQTFRRNGDLLIVRTQRKPDQSKPGSIEGLLRYGPEQGVSVIAETGAVPSGGEAIVDNAVTTPSLLWLIMGALVGGILLNIMPCVFPILGLKALALARAGGDERAVRSDALAYTAGVVISCMALGGIMLALRAGGEHVGWAFQLQEPGFVLFLLLLMAGITANLLGLFELGGIGAGDALAQKPGLAGSFWTGALAAIVATPCTGPFMAAALGAALLLPTVQALLLFAFLGLGIALPFLLIAYVPTLRNRLPKPGPWLNLFRKAMAIPMGLTAFALAWLLWRLTGNAGLLLGIGAIVALLLVIMVPIFRSAVLRNTVAARCILAAAVLVTSLYWLPTERSDAEQADSRALNAAPFSEEQLASLRGQGKPVFVYFTADWCVTCKVNEAAILEREETAKLFTANGVQVLRGDYTKRDPAIARFLSQQGAAGVPLYLYYPKGGEAQKLPQLLSQSSLQDILSKRP